ncbi:ABC transporter permease [Streptomyces sp. DSM 42041]|uniref:ABC transporter permease n=1 Tax=Streptomyces hazeniae TaxID=3075538 RepID=A0ABU2NV17_9ACTN|nr:ABC transporter permease [Streptomyces sp. DSM 42041]MDT0380816.1 ABC transporter permease [Streptomyces sp. DSM 42041]
MTTPQPPENPASDPAPGTQSPEEAHVPHVPGQAQDPAKSAPDATEKAGEAGEAESTVPEAETADRRPEHTMLLNPAQAAADGAPPQRAPAQGTMMLTPPAQPVQPPAAPVSAPQGPPPGQAPYATAPAAPAPAPVHAAAPAGGWPPPQGTAGQAALPRTHLGHALASEWTKIRTVRSTMWTLGVMFVIVVGIGFLMALAFSGSSNRFVTTPLLGGGLFGLMLGQICVITLGVLVITSEYGTGMIRTTMTACPVRGRVLLAKALVFFLVAFVMTTLAAGLTALIQAGMLGGAEVPPDAMVSEGLRESVVNGELTATGGEWLGATVGAGLYVALLGLLSLSVGAMLRHSAGAITAMLGVVLLPMLVAIFLPASLSDLQDGLLEYSPLNGLASMFQMPFQGDVGTTGWPLLGLLAVVSGAALAGAYAALANRDV